MNDIISQLQRITRRIEEACSNVGRDPGEVKLLLATKTVTVDRIKIALAAGYNLIGENKVQELCDKYDALKAVPHTSHFIGHLQTNKIKDILKCDVDCIQSLDRLELANKLHHHLTAKNKTINVLIQVNTSQETSKFGVSPGQTMDLVRQMAQMDTLRIQGLMTIGLFSAEAEMVRPCFRLLRDLQRQVIDMQIPNVAMGELSMGMSSDLEIAIEEGATIIRVGTAIFGQRIYPDSFYWNEGKG